MTSQYKLKKNRLGILVVLLLVLIALIYIVFSGNWVYSVIRSLNLVDAFSGREYILLMGTDAREGEKVLRTDTMILACLDTEQKTLNLMSIPRDTRVYIPNHGYNKINCSIAWGGFETTLQTVSDLLGIKVKHYALVDFQDFAEIIDILGGITLTVPNNMYHFDGDYTIDLPAGTYKMDGEQALQYVRYRTYALGDIQRTENQRDFLEALYFQLKQSGTVFKLPALISEISSCLTTDLSWSEMLALSYIDFTDFQINTTVLAGNFAEIKGVSYWQVDAKKVKNQAAEFFGED